ncbi:phage antirepressor N-terminal domain-containing protein [Pasteurella multocida]
MKNNPKACLQHRLFYLSWSSQHRKLENSKGKFNCAHMSIVAEDGKLREMLCMPLKKLNGWLFSINPEKVRSDLKEKVIQYQEECFEVLYSAVEKVGLFFCYV